ncbi:hypothetical protein DY000_02015585 [Brassica cretica]|uniref:Uncharacterized protein n=1 Tax=Brassica cretica TaxID=69181 RepID=A0ABQ7D2J8_BRACR|nr:hypothetical protein DY000_02015585 [Brassica cretica]
MKEEITSVFTLALDLRIEKRVEPDLKLMAFHETNLQINVSGENGRAKGRSMKKGARIGDFPRRTIQRSSTTVDPTRSSQTIVLDIYGSIKVEPQRKQHHNSGCMTSRHTRSNAQGPLFTLGNEELARLERQNRQQPRPTNTIMVDHGGQDYLTAAMALMQQQMQQMQQTINAQEAAPQAAADLAAQQSQVFIMEEAASENNVSDATPEGDNTVDDQQESRVEQRLSETIPGKNICPDPSAAQPVPEPETANCSTDRSFASDCSARRDKGSSDDDAAVAPGSANSRESVETGHHGHQ